MEQQYKEYLEMIERMAKSKKLDNKKYHQGYFTNFKNPMKCENVIYKKACVFRSSWEKMFMEWLDTQPAVVSWSSELVKIVYPNPLTNRSSFYYPDFMISYVDKLGNFHKEMIEIKGRHEAVLKETHNARDRLLYIQNLKKFEYAIKWCQPRGIKFRVLTEKELFRC